mmetsp:Transcript_3159/g.5360  ORF Transcript_3159/g.5360 Transcript_3159/m.5360 type:complete len:95 (+) Transcript_3159:251-535(+)
MSRSAVRTLHPAQPTMQSEIQNCAKQAPLETPMSVLRMAMLSRTQHFRQPCQPGAVRKCRAERHQLFRAVGKPETTAHYSSLQYDPEAATHAEV